MKDASENFSIKNWSLDDRPREKLLHKGKNSLSNAELIAILIGSGNREESAVGLSQRMLSSFENNLNALGKAPISRLMKFKGIGEAKAIAISAALEIGSRRGAEEAVGAKKISGSASAFALLQPVLGELPHEEFWIIYMNNNHTIIQMDQLSKGGITGTLVDARLMLRRALEVGAVALILAHNHPSGKLKPSQADKNLTTKLTTASAVLDIKVLDHIIVTEKSYFSFADEGLL